jgi:hypothetical protein
LALYSKLSTILTPGRGSLDVARPNSAGQTLAQPCAILCDAGSVEKTGDFDAASLASLAELRTIMDADKSIHEIYAKTPASKFIISKILSDSGAFQQKTEDLRKQVHMIFGNKEANLTDAEREHAPVSQLQQR